jgi:hypothetical protein
MSTPTDTPATKEMLTAGWQALARTEWDRARSLFEAAVGRDESGEALEGLSLAAWWLDDAETLFAKRERAYQLYRRDGDLRSAGRVATLFGIDYYSFRGESAIGNGWFRRAHRLLEELPPAPRARLAVDLGGPDPPPRRQRPGHGAAPGTRGGGARARPGRP